MFYQTWETQVDLLPDEELRRFIKNLLRYDRGEDPDLITTLDKMAWAGVLPAMDTNKGKYEKRVIASRENGKMGGAPRGNQNAKKEETTQNNLNNLIKENREMIIEKGEKEKDNSEEENDKGQKVNDNGKKENRGKRTDSSKKETGNSEGETENKKNGNNEMDNTSSNNPNYISKSEPKQLLDEIFNDYCPEWEEELFYYEDIDSFFRTYNKYLELYSQLDLDKLVDLTGIKCSRLDWLKNVINDYWINKKKESSVD